jgi:hypothetical protein
VHALLGIECQLQYNKQSVYIFSEAERELAKLSQLAGQLNPRLEANASSSAHVGGGGCDNVNVDLDQLFNFLSGEAGSTIASESVAGSSSEVAAGDKSSILDEIDRQMSDLQNEIDLYSLEEGVSSRELSPPPLPPPSATIAGVPPPPPMQLGKPSLPEPEGPPPPPPTQNGYAFNTPHISQEVRNPLKINKVVADDKPKEPIYESIKPRPDPVGGNEAPMYEYNEAMLPPPPPPLMPPPGRTATPPPPPATSIPPPPPPLGQVNDNNSDGVYQARQNNKQRSRQQHQQDVPQQLPADLEREARRMERVKKGLERIQESDKENNLGNNEAGGERLQELNIMEFAEIFFNDHEKCSPQTTLVDTLRRRGSKANLVDMMPREEMVTYCKASTIPTSHIHLFDPENVNLAVKMFRELLRYSRGDCKTAEAEVSVIQDIVRQGIEVEELRDEIYVQCVRQLTDNPCEEQIQRLWLLLCLVVVAFTPSKAFFKVRLNKVVVGGGFDVSGVVVFIGLIFSDEPNG